MRRMLAGLLALSIVAVSAAEGAEVSELIGKLKEKDSDVRRAAAKELADLGVEAKPAVPDLTKALRDRDLFVRRFAAEALGNIGADSKSAIPALSTALNDEKKEVQLAAIEALGKIGPDSITALLSALKDPNKDPAVRKKAAQGLAKIGPKARGAVPALSDIVRGKFKMSKNNKMANEDDIRADAATALGAVAKSEDKAAIDALKSVSEGKQRNKGLQKAAGDALRQLTGKGPDRKKK